MRNILLSNISQTNQNLQNLINQNKNEIQVLERVQKSKRHSFEKQCVIKNRVRNLEAPKPNNR